MLITEPRIKLMDNVVYELVIHIYQKSVFGGLSLVMACILPIALYADGSWFRDSDLYSFCYGFYSPQNLFQVVSLRALAIASLDT